MWTQIENLTSIRVSPKQHVSTFNEPRVRDTQLSHFAVQRTQNMMKTLTAILVHRTDWCRLFPVSVDSLGPHLVRCGVDLLVLESTALGTR